MLISHLTIFQFDIIIFILLNIKYFITIILKLITMYGSGCGDDNPEMRKTRGNTRHKLHWELMQLKTILCG